MSYRTPRRTEHAASPKIKLDARKAQNPLNLNHDLDAAPSPIKSSGYWLNTPTNIRMHTYECTVTE